LIEIKGWASRRATIEADPDPGAINAKAVSQVGNCVLARMPGRCALAMWQYGSLFNDTN